MTGNISVSLQDDRFFSTFVTPQNVTVNIRLASDNSIVDTDNDVDGSTTFSNLPVGDYLIEVISLGGGGEPAHNQVILPVQVLDGATTLEAIFLEIVPAGVFHAYDPIALTDQATTDITATHNTLSKDATGKIQLASLDVDYDMNWSQTINGQISGALEINNTSAGPLENVAFNFVIQDAGGNPVPANEYQFLSTNITGVDASGEVPAGGTARFEYTVGVGPNAGPGPYTLKGSHSYTNNGDAYAFDIAPFDLPVTDIPQLKVDLFLQRENSGDYAKTDYVEESAPSFLGILLTNSGISATQDLQLTMPQPQVTANPNGVAFSHQFIGNGQTKPIGDILWTSGPVPLGYLGSYNTETETLFIAAPALPPSIDTNPVSITVVGIEAVMALVDQLGLGIEFIALPGSSGFDISPDLTINYGTIAPGEVVAKNYVLSSTPMSVAELTSAVTTDLGPFSGTIDSTPTLHDLVRLVADTRTGADTLGDYLVDGVPDPNLLADTLYLSDGTIESVAQTTGIFIDSDGSDGEVTLQITYGAGWSFLDIDVPGQTIWSVLGATYSDGSDFEYRNIWSTLPNLSADGLSEVQGNRINLLEYNAAAGTKTINIEVFESIRSLSPVAAVFDDDTFDAPRLEKYTFNDALAAAANGEGIDPVNLPGALTGEGLRVDNPAFVGEIGARIVTIEDLTVQGDDPFRATFRLDTGISEFTLQGSTTSDAYGNALGNTINGSDGANWIAGLDGDDALNGGAGHDTLLGVDGNDTLMGDAGDDRLFGGLGDDDIQTGTGLDRVYAGGGNDSVTAGAGNTFVFGAGGNDTVQGGTGDDTLRGGAGQDSLNGGSGDDLVLGGAGDDALIEGDAGNDTLFGEGGDDLLSGGTENDELSGGNGADTLWGGKGNDTVIGGNGADALSGDEGNDGLAGGAAFDTILGGDGDDTLDGGVGNDSLHGGANNDSLNGRQGEDTLLGGDGSDHISGGGEADVIDGGAGDDSIYAGAGDDTMVVGGSGKDFISGGSGNDSLDGGSESDILVGDGGADTLRGGAGDDTLEGGGVGDFLNGGTGSDVVDGGNGNDILFVAKLEGGDTLTGGAGQDMFVFEGGFGTATILDFSSGLDEIDLSGTALTSFMDLTIAYTADASVDLGKGDTLTLMGITGGLTENDFAF